MIRHDDATHAAPEAAAPEANQQDRQDDHGSDHQAALAPAGPVPWAPMQARSLTRHTGTLASKLHTPPVALPHQAALEGEFGQSLGGIEAHVGEHAAVADLGGIAAAEGDLVAFADTSPARETVAHEVAHVLQARSGKPADHAGAEAEADRVKASVAGGAPVGPITQGAAGVHLDKGETGGVPPLDPLDLGAREFLKALHDISTYTYSALRLNKGAEKHPYAKYLKPASGMSDAMFAHPAVRPTLIEPFHEKIEGLIAPEPLEALVDKARAAHQMFGAGLGPEHHVYMESVGVALGNAMTRQFQHSLTRMLPRYVQASKPRMAAKKDAHGQEWWTHDHTPEGTELAVSHPLDRIVAYGLCSRSLEVDVEAFAQQHPDLVKAAREESRPIKREIQLTFPWERNLWHWVEARADADDLLPVSVEEVARTLFGSEDQAYRLTPMPPLFGFRNTDVAAFVGDYRKKLDELARDHHPHPQIANAGDIGAINNSHTEAERTAQIQEASRTNRFPTAMDPALRGPRPQFPGGPQLQEDPPANGPAKPVAPAPIKVFPVRDDVDPAAELAESQDGKKIAKDRAKQAAAGHPGPKHDEAQVYERAGDCVDLVAPTKQAFVALGLPTTLLDKQLGTFLKTQRTSVDACFEDADAEFALVDEQAKLLKRISQGATDTAAHLPLYKIPGKDGKTSPETPQVKDLPSFAKGPVEEASHAFGEAVSGLPFPDIAKPRVDRAEHLAKTLRISVLEQSMHETRPTLQTAMDTPDDKHADAAKYDPDDLAHRNDNILMELSRQRVLMDSDPAQAETDFAKTQEKAGDYSFEVAVVGNLEALDALWGAAHSTSGFWQSGIDADVRVRLESANRDYYTYFNEKVYTPYTQGVSEKNKTKKEAAKKAFDALVKDAAFQKHFEEVQQHIKDDAKHKKWTKIIVGIAIAVVAMGLGQFYFGAMLAGGGSVLGAAVGAAVVETSVGTVLNKVILDQDPTVGGLITGFVGAGVMYSVLGTTLRAGRALGAGADVAEAAERASLLSKSGKFVADTAKEALMVQAIGVMQGEVANYIDTGKLLTEEQLKEMFVHNIAGLVGMKIGQRIVDVTLDPMKPLREMGRSNAVDIEGLIREKDDLEKLAKQLEASKDKTAAEHLIEREKAFLEKVRDARERLLELAQKHPGKVNAAQLKDLKAMPEGGQDFEALQAQAMMNLEELGPNLYRAEPQAFDAILALHKQAGDKLVGVHTDPNSGMRSLEFKTPEGTLVKIKEKIGDVGHREAPPVAAGEAHRFEQWLEHEMTAPDATQLAVQRQRLRDYYAHDPRGAMHAAESHGFAREAVPDTATLATKPDERARAAVGIHDDGTARVTARDAEGRAIATESRSIDGNPAHRQTFHNAFEKLSPDAQIAVRQLEEKGWVSVDKVHAHDLIEISKWFGKEIGVVRTPVGRLRLILGTADGVMKTQILSGETFVVHTHPVMVTDVSHFGVDLAAAGPHIEGVIDWSGQMTFFDKHGLKNEVRQDATVRRNYDLEAAFLDEGGNIIAFADISVTESPQGTQIKVK